MALKHRGPEGVGVKALPGATLAHVRLRINDLSTSAAQPMSNEDGSVWATFNGEIYNFVELRNELQRLGHQFASRSDTEVIVHGYEQWGLKVVERLDGMFAFGVWDCNLSRLMVARDRAGKKPVFYAQHDGRFLFASEPKALFAAQVPPVPSDEAIVGYLAYGYVPAPRTAYSTIHELLPAHLLTVDARHEPDFQRYWQVGFETSADTPSIADAMGAVRSLMTRAVQKRLVADVPVGAFLSGGLDSTIVVGLMCQQANKVSTFAIGCDDRRYDEAPFGRSVAKHFGTDHHELKVAPSDLELIPQLVGLYDGPVGDSSSIPTYLVCKLARRSVTVALTGDGGDEVFAGYLRFAAASVTEQIPAPLRTLLQLARTPGASPSIGRDLLSRAKRLLAAAALPLGDRIAEWTSPFVFALPSLLVPRLSQLAKSTLAFHRAYFEPGIRSTLAQVLEHNFLTYLPSDVLVKVDRCSMAHALEARSPFLDTALVDYVGKLPNNFKLRGRTGKYILRKAFADLVPKEVAARGKMGFGIPLGAWFRKPCRSYLLDHIGNHRAQLWHYVQKPFVDRLIHEHMHAVTDHSHKLWTLLTLEVWLQSLANTNSGAAKPSPQQS